MSSLQCPATLLIARHADAEYESAVWSPQGGSLTNVGREQASSLGRQLVERRIAHVYASPLARAVQTAELAAAQLDVAVTTRECLREFAIGSFEGSTARDPFAPVYARWLSGELEASWPGGETGVELVERMRAVLQEISDLHRGETVLVVSHGGLMRMALPVLLIQDPAVLPERIGNTAVVECQIDDVWTCVTWPPPAAPGE